MTVLIDNRQSHVNIEKDAENFIENLVNAVLEYESCTDDYEVSISLVSNEEIRDLNRVYRNVDAATDVLSFPMIEFEEDNENKLQAESCDDFEDSAKEYIEEELPLGDIVISVEKAKEQAQEYGHSLKRELSFLLVHGMLHLLGYDHENKKDETIMFQKQEQILDKLNIRR